MSLKTLINYLFLFGVFLIPSALAFATFFLLVASIFGIIFWRKNLNTLINKSIIFAALLLIFICFCQSVVSLTTKEYNPQLTWTGLFNWLPLFLLFLGSQTFLQTPKERKLTGIVLIAGSFPVLLTGFGQYFFNWHGPFEAFNGLIIWFQRPIDKGSVTNGLTGLFNNLNYAGCWLSIIWPFCIASFFEKTKNVIHKSFSSSFLIAVLVAILLTTSRNAYGGLLLTLPILIGNSSLFWLFPLGFIFYFSGNFLSEMQLDFIQNNYAMSTILDKIQGLKEIGNDPRLLIWGNSLEMISQKPILGWGAGVYPIIFLNKYGFPANHSHNLFLDLGFNYGIAVALTILVIIIFLVFSTFKLIFFRREKINSQGSSENFYEKAWWTSFFVLFLSQMVDVQYYDGRISIMFWILLAGLSNILKGYDTYLEDKTNS